MDLEHHINNEKYIYGLKLIKILYTSEEIKLLNIENI